MVSKVVIRNLNDKVLPVDVGRQTLLHAFQQAGQDWMFACGGKGRCTTCRLRVEVGGALLDAPTPAEQRFRNQGRLRTDERLACQCRFAGPGTVVAHVPPACQLPHLTYHLPPG